MDEKEDVNEKKFIRNRISFFLISFYSGICVISDLGVKYYFKDKKKVETALLTKILLLFKLPYLIKPLYGLLIDFFPICGYKKKYYLFICFFINIISWYIFIISGNNNNNNLLTSIICQLLINISLSFTTVIGSAIQIEISKKYKNSKNGISEKSSELMSQYFIIKSIGTLIPSFFKGFLIEKYSNDIIFYISGIISFFIFISGIILEEDKIIKKKTIKKHHKNTKIILSHLIEEEEEQNNNNNHINKKNKIDQIIDLIKDRNITVLLTIIFILESSPSSVSPLFYYETNILGLNPKDLGLIDFFSQISIILVIIIYKNVVHKFNFKLITFLVKISMFFIYSLIYLLIMRITQKYISDLYLVTFATSLNAGLHSLGQLPYSLLAIQFSPKNLEATTYSLCIFSCYLGNIFSDYIDYGLAIYFNVTHYNFENLGILIFIENILNLIQLLYILAIPTKYFSENKNKYNDTPEKPISVSKQKN